jgi:hypothetical protein
MCVCVREREKEFECTREGSCRGRCLGPPGIENVVPVDDWELLSAFSVPRRMRVACCYRDTALNACQTAALTRSP